MTDENRMGGAAMRWAAGGNGPPIEFVLVPATLFLIVPASIARTAGESLSDIPGLVWTVAMAAVGVAIVVIRVVDALVRRLGGGSAFSTVVKFFCFFVVWSGLVLPIGAVHGLEDSTQARVMPLRIVAAILVAFGLTLFARTSWGRHLWVGLFIFCFGNLIAAVVPELTDRRISASAALEVSESLNVVVLGFDGLGTAAATQALQESAELRSGLAGFTLYENAMSTSPATSANLAAELYGYQDFDVLATTQDELWELEPDRLLTNFLATKGFTVTTYGVYSGEAGPDVRQVKVSKASGSNFFRLINLALVRSTGVLALKGGIGSWVEGILGKAGYPTGQGEPLYRAVLRSDIPEWDRDLTMSAVDLDAATRGIRTSGNAPHVTFLHFTHTHYPVKWDRDCQFRASDQHWYQQSQNFGGEVEESACALSQAVAVVERLDSLGVLDVSMVVVKGDHGPPVDYAPEGSVDSTRINGHPLWGLSRYSPFLAIKPTGERGEKLVVSASSVVLSDLARTICEEALGGPDCSHYVGYNVLRDPIPADDEVLAFVVDESDDSHEFEDHVAVRFERGKNSFRSLHQALLELDMVDSDLLSR